MTVRRVGVLGAGQLALMLAEAAPPLGLEIVCAGAPGDCAAQVAEVVETDLADAASVRRFAEGLDVLTIESENIDAGVLAGLPLAPSAGAIAIAQDRLLEKQFLARCGMEVAPYAAVSSLHDLRSALAMLGTPAILKTRRLGYDGKGQVRLYSSAEAGAAWAAVSEAPALLEGFVAFETEVSLLAARSAQGEVVFYPLTHNVHREGILRMSRAPLDAARFDAAGLQRAAEGAMRTVLEELRYVGVLAIEFFVVYGRLVANEMAPRVHNSGHWTIEGAETSQFANHLRAIAGLPLGSTAATPTVMLNCIGQMPTHAATVRAAGGWCHDYGKQPRAGRKVGHLTFPASATDAIALWQTRVND